MSPVHLVQAVKAVKTLAGHGLEVDLNIVALTDAAEAATETLAAGAAAEAHRRLTLHQGSRSNHAATIAAAIAADATEPIARPSADVSLYTRWQLSEAVKSTYNPRRRLRGSRRRTSLPTAASEQIDGASAVTSYTCWHLSEAVELGAIESTPTPTAVAAAAETEATEAIAGASAISPYTRWQLAEAVEATEAIAGASAVSPYTRWQLS